MIDPISGAGAPPRPKRCKDCGLLTMKHLETHAFIEVDSRYREEGKRTGVLNQAGPEPLCFVGAANLVAEFDAADSSSSERRALAVIDCERDCLKSTPWLMGRTPIETLKIMELDEQRRHNEELRKADLLWKAEQDRISRRQSMRNSVILAVIGAVLAYIVALLKPAK